MKFPWLKDALEQEGPFRSLYIDTTRTNENAATEITKTGASSATDRAAPRAGSTGPVTARLPPAGPP